MNPPAPGKDICLYDGKQAYTDDANDAADDAADTANDVVNDDVNDAAVDFQSSVEF